MLKYKVVETSTVTDEQLEGIINEWVAAGWLFEGIQFAMRECSKRPAMAFVIFTRTEEDLEDDLGCSSPKFDGTRSNEPAD